jgi:hypothetical protein
VAITAVILVLWIKSQQSMARSNTDPAQKKIPAV